MVHSAPTSARASASASEGGVNGFEDCGKLFPPGVFDSTRSGRGSAMASGGSSLPIGWEAMSGKFAVVARMLALLREQTKDRIVIVSNYTQTLDLFTSLCRERGYPVLRLDGSTSIGKRQKLVKRFNDPTDNQFVFLLSSKAGGCGLNLIGGNRLILFDMSWNPADDKQAAARVWRDGQRRRVYVYRFMTTGTIEEKVYQRQLSKEGLQAVVETKAAGGGGGGAAVMSLEELRDLFSYDPDTLSTTYDHMVATKGLPKKKKQDPVKKGKKAQQSKGKNKSGANKKGRKNAIAESSEEEEEYNDVADEDNDEINLLAMSDGEEERSTKKKKVVAKHADGVICDSEEEKEEDEQVEIVEAPAAGAVDTPPAPSAHKALLSAALAASGGIHKAQDGKPKEEDLASWGHHSDPRTVPDDCMKLSGGEDVTFVFSCEIDGRDVPLDPPLVPLGQGKAATAGVAGLGHMRRPVGGVGPPRSSSMPPPAPRQALKESNATVPKSVLPQPVKRITPVPPAPKIARPEVVAAPAMAVSAPGADGKAPKITGAKRRSPHALPSVSDSRPAVKSHPSAKKPTKAATAPTQKRRSSGDTAPKTTGTSAAKRAAIMYDSDDDFV